MKTTQTRRPTSAPAQGRGQAGGDCLVAALDLDKIPQELKARLIFLKGGVPA